MDTDYRFREPSQVRGAGNVYTTLFLFFWFFFFSFLGLNLQHMQVARLGVEWELQLPCYATATEMWDPSHICNLHHSSRQHQTPDPLSKARGRTHILMDTSWIRFHWATMGSPMHDSTLKSALWTWEPPLNCLQPQLFFFFFFLSPWLCLGHMEVLGLRINPKPQQ